MGTNCHELGKYVITPGNKTSDATCSQADKLCSCAGGTPARGRDCPENGASRCIACPHMHRLLFGTCQKVVTSTPPVVVPDTDMHEGSTTASPVVIIGIAVPTVLLVLIL